MLRHSHATLGMGGPRVGLAAAPPSAKSSDTSERRATKMVDSRLIHLETEMTSMFGRLQDSEKRMLALRRQLEEKTRLANELKDSNLTLKFEADSMYKDMQRAETSRDKAESEVEKLIFDQAELGFLPGKKTETGGMVGPTQVITVQAANINCPAGCWP